MKAALSACDCCELFSRFRRQSVNVLMQAVCIALCSKSLKSLSKVLKLFDMHL